MAEAANLALKAARVEAFPLFRPVLRRVKSLTSFDNPDNRVLVALFRLDPSSTAKFLRAANASGFARQAHSVEEAFEALGPQSLRSCIASLLDAALEQEVPRGTEFNMFRWWAHCLGTAFAAQRLATDVMPQRTAETYTLGLLHELGVIAMHQFVPELFDKAILLSVEESLLLRGCERHTIGADSQTLSVEISRSWRLPKDAEAVAHYHANPLEAPDEVFAISALICLANHAAMKAGFGHQWFTKFDEVAPTVAEKLGAGDGLIAESTQAARRGVAAASRALLARTA